MNIIKQNIKTLNIILISLSIFILTKTSATEFILNLESITIVNYLFKNFSYGNAEASSIAASVLAAYIFYFINNYLPEVKKKEEHIIFISPRLKDILNNISSIFRIVNEQSKEYLRFPLQSYSSLNAASDKIKFGDIYKGSATIEIDNGIHKIVDREIEYHVIVYTKNCLNRIHDLRLTNTVLDDKLLTKLDNLESQLKDALRVIELITKVKRKRDNFSQAMTMYEFVYNSAKDLMSYYRKNISDKELDCDIWFNKKTRNFERIKQEDS